MLHREVAKGQPDGERHVADDHVKWPRNDGFARYHLGLGRPDVEVRVLEVAGGVGGAEVMYRVVGLALSYIRVDVALAALRNSSRD